MLRGRSSQELKLFVFSFLHRQVKKQLANAFYQGLTLTFLLTGRSGKYCSKKSQATKDFFSSLVSLYVLDIPLIIRYTVDSN